VRVSKGRVEAKGKKEEFWLKSPGDSTGNLGGTVAGGPVEKVRIKVKVNYPALANYG
jgi:hypothetical protein